MSPVIVLLVITGLQALLMLGVGAVALGLKGDTERQGVRLFGASMLVMGLQLIASNGAFWLAMNQSDGVLLRTGISVLAQFLAFWHLGLLSLSLYAIQQRRAPPAHAAPVAIGAALLVALLLTLPGAFDADAAGQRLQMRLGLRYLGFSVVYAVIGSLVLSVRPRGGMGLGQWGIGLSLGALALIHALGFYLVMAPPLPLAAQGYTVWLQLLSLVGYLLLSLGSALWLHERTAADAQARQLASDRAMRLDLATGLSSRIGLMETVGARVAPHAALTFVAVRLLRFNTLQRSLGADWGVQTLRQLSDVALDLPDCLAIGRIEGNRLGLALAAGERNASRSVHELSQRLEEAALAMPQPIRLSLGYAVRQGDEALEPLLAAACMAQESAETSGQPCVRFQTEQAEIDRAETELLGALYRAIGQDQLVLHVQGIFDSGSLQLRGVEALLRWQHPSLGLMPPGDFLPAAERGGLMIDVDMWVLARSTRWLRQRLDDGLPICPVSINLSMASAMDPGLPGRIAQVLKQHALEAEWLEFELTESDAMGNPQQVAANVRALRALGARTALDDLGTGYSSLSHLRDLRVDRLKIDRSFLAGGDHVGQAIAAALAALATQLGCDAVAEGVETHSQLAFCREHDVDLVQGWLLHRPSAEWPPEQAQLPAPL